MESKRVPNRFVAGFLVLGIIAAFCFYVHNTTTRMEDSEDDLLLFEEVSSKATESVSAPILPESKVNDKPMIAKATTSIPNVPHGVRVSSIEPLLVSGVVIDDNGEGVFGAVVSCRLKGRRRGSNRRGELTVTCGKNGTFEIRGPSLASGLVLHSDLEGYFSERIEVDCGAENVELRLRFMAKLVGKVTSGSNAEVGELFVRLVGGQRMKEAVFAVGWDRTIDIDLVPGKYDLSLIEHRHGKIPLLTRSNLTLSSGLTLDLGSLRLSATGETIELDVDLRVLGEDPYIGGQIRVYDIGSDNLIQENHVEFYGGPMKFYVKKMPVELEVEISGFRVLRTLVDRKKTKIVMIPGPIVTPVFEGLQDMRSDVYLMVRMGGMNGVSMGWFKATGEVPPQRLSRGGQYRVEVMIGLERKNSFLAGEILKLDSPDTVEIDDNEAHQNFTLRINKESLENFLNQRRRRASRTGAK